MLATPHTPFYRSLYGRIAAIYLLLSLVLALLSGWATVYHFRLFVTEVEQKLNRGFAAKLGMLVGEELQQGAYADAVAKAVEQTTMFFPALELYVLDAAGEVLVSSVADSAISDRRVPLAPIHTLQDTEAILPVWGLDPRLPGEQKIFSAAPVTMSDSLDGYLYVVLRGEAAVSAETMLQNSYLMRALPLYLLLTLGLTLLVGLLLFGILTGRFRRLTDSVHRFKEGDFDHRVAVSGNDEIGQLGRAFNDMATTIQGQVDVLRETDVRRRDLVANISHDFRTPLTSIRGHAERLLRKADQLDTSSGKEGLDTIIKNADRLERLSSHLNELSRLDAGSLEPHLEPFPVNELVNDVLQKLHPQAEDWQVTLEAPDSSRRLVVFADIGLVERLLTNLIHNALQNTPAGGRVTIFLQHVDQRIRVTVADTGRGIPADELPLVQQRFYQLHRKTLHGREGSGLGLSIAHEIAALHDSVLHIESSEGAGTTVSFSLALDKNRKKKTAVG